ncbi:hypothetical protein FRUB_09491 [Fimbriiglobus ruber]|uniref:Uncharacterized protein n=1 Tax=Fimbriiglobus ruber TaxID=1908690 RepID=A0A225D149_9BACT|nr:hypothetical protein FRUB_09491 [Fimbriiglobus ruber]
MDPAPVPRYFPVRVIPDPVAEFTLPVVIIIGKENTNSTKKKTRQP